MKKGLVSIVIPCYNGERYLDMCFGALLQQTFKNFEVIIVNDGSTDKTSEKIDEYIKIFENKGIKLKKIEQSNMGQAAAVNNALKHVTGEFLMWQDCDDYYEKDAIMNLKTFLDNNPDFQMVRGGMRRVDYNTKRVMGEERSKYPEKKNVFNAYLFETDSYCYAGVFMIRTEYFDKCIPGREIYVSKGGQNWQLILPVAYRGKCESLSEIVYNYNFISSSHSHKGTGMVDFVKRGFIHKKILRTIIKQMNLSRYKTIYYFVQLEFKYIYKPIRFFGKKVKRWCKEKWNCVVKKNV